MITRCYVYQRVTILTNHDEYGSTEAYIRHWLMRYYLDLVKIIARNEIIIAWCEIIKTCYAKIITLYAIFTEAYIRRSHTEAYIRHWLMRY